jgi:hypothetical protein
MPEARLHQVADPATEAGLRKTGSVNVQVFDAHVGANGYSVIVSRDPLCGDRDDMRWHVSVAGERDVPTWADLAAIAHGARPGVPFALGVPPRSWWLNVHEHCLHLWEVVDRPLLAQWRSERVGHTPT